MDGHAALFEAQQPWPWNALERVLGLSLRHVSTAA